MNQNEIFDDYLAMEGVDICQPSVIAKIISILYRNYKYNTIQKQWYKYGEVDWVLMASILDEYKYRWFPDLAHLVAATSRLSLSKKVEIDNLLVEDEFMDKIFGHLESYYRRED